MELEVEIDKEKFSHRAKVSMLERCFNCLVFSSCDLSNASSEACMKFISLPIEKQSIVVNLIYFSSLKGLNSPNCSY
jgi:hypothetical protein